MKELKTICYTVYTSPFDRMCISSLIHVLIIHILTYFLAIADTVRTIVFCSYDGAAVANIRIMRRCI